MSEIRVENIIGETGTDAVRFTKGINVTGIVTATNVSIGSSVTATNFFGSGASLTNLPGGGKLLKQDYTVLTSEFSTTSTSSYVDVTNVDSIGVITARDGIRCTGIVTATAFHGDGANLTGVSGFSTALGNTQGTLENLVFKTTESFTVGAGQSIRLESDNMSGNTIFTRLGRINVSTGATFHVSAGTTFIMNVLSVF